MNVRADSSANFVSSKKYSRMNPLLRGALLIIAASSVFADYQAGLDAYLQGDFDTAIVEWQAVVESAPGTVPPAVHAETLYAIGMLFWMGQGVEQDSVESASWLHLAAEMNHPGAQNKLGFLYSAGQGVRQSDFEAFQWWQLAANQGNADAQYNLGVLYRDGLGVEPNPGESMKWFREAASNGDPISIGIVKQSDSSEVPMKPLMVDQYAAGEDWIRDRDPEHYTIQVIALSAPEKLHMFMASHLDLEPFAIYRQARYKNLLWVLVQGDYADLNSARIALQGFPEGMQERKKLWIRRFQMVQSLLE